MKAWIVFIGAIALQFMAGCHDDPQPPGPSVNEAEMVRQLKEYTYFKEGSYWVYADSATGDLDSMFVYYADEGEGVDGNGERYYWFNCFIYSTRDSFEYHHWFHSSWTGRDPYRSKLFRIKTKPGDNVGETIIFEYPVVPGNQLYTYGNATQQNVVRTEFYADTLQIGALLFHNTICVSESMDPSEGSRGAYYVGKYIGVVAHNIVGASRKWQLIRWNTVQ